MAEIDKSLPNTKTTIEIPGQTEVDQTIQEQVEQAQDPSVEINMNEDGGAEISLIQVLQLHKVVKITMQISRLLDESILTEIGSEFRRTVQRL